MTDTTPDTTPPARGGHRPRKGISPEAQAYLTDLGSVARAHRNANGISPATVADRSGDDVSQIHKFERGELNPTLARLFPILAGMGLRLVLVKTTDPADATSALPVGYSLATIRPDARDADA